MYALEQRVWIKSLKSLGTISKRGYNVSLSDGKTRTAYYVVQVKDKPGWNYLTGSRDLRAADVSCDGCNKYLPRSSFNGVPQPRDPEGYVVAEFCFLCYLGFRKEYGYI